LFAGCGSVWNALVVAQLMIAALALDATSAVTRICADPPSRIVPSEQSIAPAVVHEPCEGSADTTDKPAGIGSDTRAWVAVSGPWFRTTSVYINSPPGNTDAPDAALAIDTSASQPAVLGSAAKTKVTSPDRLPAGASLTPLPPAVTAVPALVID
jgi:hypothetical protein